MKIKKVNRKLVQQTFCASEVCPLGASFMRDDFFATFRCTEASRTNESPRAYLLCAWKLDLQHPRMMLSNCSGICVPRNGKHEGVSCSECLSRLLLGITLFCFSLTNIVLEKKKLSSIVGTMSVRKMTSRKENMKRKNTAAVVDEKSVFFSFFFCFRWTRAKLCYIKTRKKKTGD